MARPFRLWGKKRGQRQSGSKLAGGVGEAVFFSVLFLLGTISLAALITTQVVYASEPPRFSGWALWLLVSVFSSFVLIGGGGIIFTVLNVGASTERRAAFAKRAADFEQLLETLPSPKDYPQVPSDANYINSPGINLTYRLPITQSSVWRLSTSAAFCLLSTAMAVVLLAVAVGGHWSGKPDWFLTAFLIPLLAMAGWAFYYFIRQVIVHTGVGTTSVEISDHPLHPGGQYRILLSQSGRLTVNTMQVTLVCEEEATYHQGTDVRTEIQPVYSQDVFQRENVEIKPGAVFEHSAHLTIPIEAMHSFQSSSNSVHWKLVVKGHAEGWPDYERSFPVVVYPGANGKATK